MNEQSSTRHSTAPSIRAETFEEITGRFAGQPVNSDHVDGRDFAIHVMDDRQSEYEPFSNATEYALVHWFLQAKCSKGDINRFLSDPRLLDIHKLVTFETFDEMIELVHEIPYGIQNDGWTTTEITITSDIQGVLDNTYKLRFRDIQKSIEFLIGHRPFADSLAYAPIRYYNGDNNERIYNELHTADWWWDTQLQLPTGATVIPVLLSTDKTIMTQHHGDEACWPVYMTIGNLNAATRRKQTVPGSVMLAQLPILKENTNKDDIKAHAYHTAMEIILQRKTSKIS
jgi:hypothetical protein